MTSLTSRIETAFLSIIRKQIPDVDQGGLAQDHATKHWLLDTAWIIEEGLDITELSTLLADAIDIRVDPPEAA